MPRASGIPYGDGLVKNRYVGRTFIQPSQQQRDQGVRVKLNPLPENIRGKRLVVVEDSIVRGTTTRQLVAMLREAGAEEVHFRVSSPPYKWPCYYGLDTGRRSELLAADMSVGEIRDFLKVDSLAYLDLDHLIRATGAASDGFCTACLSGNYPIPVPVALERRQAGAGAARSRARSRPTTRSPTAGISPRRPGRDVGSPLRPADLFGRRRRHRRRREGSRAHQGARPLHVPARGHRRHRRLRWAVRVRRSPPHRSGAGVVDRRRGHEVDDRPAHEQVRHHRHRPRRDVGRRHRGAGRRAALLPRLHLDRQGRPRSDRRDRRRCCTRMPRRGLRAPRWRDVGAPRSHGARRVRSRRLRHRCGRAHPHPSRRGARGRQGRRHREPGAAQQRVLTRASRAARPRRAVGSTNPRGTARTTRSATS